ncbi:hypothetical protein R0G64_32325, partial [Pseudomonas otitidis]
KTTCANLLMRFYDVEGGAIRVGGVDVRDIPLAGLRQVQQADLQQPGATGQRTHQRQCLDQLDHPLLGAAA